MRGGDQDPTETAARSVGVGPPIGFTCDARIVERTASANRVMEGGRVLSRPLQRESGHEAIGLREPATRAVLAGSELAAEPTP